MNPIPSQFDRDLRPAATPQDDALGEPGFEGLVFAATCALASLIVYVVVVVFSAA